MPTAAGGSECRTRVSHHRNALCNCGAKQKTKSKTRKHNPRGAGARGQW